MMNRRNALKKTALIASSAMAVPSLFSLLQSCKEQNRLEWTPLFLNEEQARFISAFVDTLLPKTETPGALEVKTDIFLDLVFAKTYNAAVQEKLRADINKFNEDCNQSHGKVFAELDMDKRKALFRQLEVASPKYNPKVWGSAVGDQAPVGFYRSLKSMTLWGYFTSEEIGLNHLNYDPVPGEYRGCVPLSEIGKTWSL
ncbi:gluconate 2-dehydrogenase subunit 3 family protein [Cecembia sp.]|uniref:gluconate 2-dehydrogenase subunit 3 family protein n=1 Tax=Cecembia sp. TaxID=1898110 RepID=UPI0025BFC8DE|nr:gluconate 2-dehydrogenase subunit 3 family protein [Cecembia sp.]